MCAWLFSQAEGGFFCPSQYFFAVPAFCFLHSENVDEDVRLLRWIIKALHFWSEQFSCIVKLLLLDRSGGNIHRVVCPKLFWKAANFHFRKTTTPVIQIYVESDLGGWVKFWMVSTSRLRGCSPQGHDAHFMTDLLVPLSQGCFTLTGLKTKQLHCNCLAARRAFGCAMTAQAVETILTPCKVSSHLFETAGNIMLYEGDAWEKQEKLLLLQNLPRFHIDDELLSSKLNLSLIFLMTGRKIWGVCSIFFFQYYDRLTSALFISGFEKQIYCSSEANLTGHSGLHHCRTTAQAAEPLCCCTFCAQGPKAPPPSFLLPSSSNSSPLCSDSPTTLLCRSLTRLLALSVHAQQSLFHYVFHSTKPLSHLSLDFWVILCTLTIKAPLHYPNPEAPINLLGICPSSDVTPCIPAVWGWKTAESGSYYEIITSQK